MIDAIRTVLRDTGRFARCCPLLFLLPVAVEAVQHLIEWQAGFYDSLSAMKAAGDDGLRMAIGHLKVAALFLTAFAMTRFLVIGDAQAAVRADRRTLRLYAPVIAWGLFWLVLVQDGPLLAAALGWPARPIGLAIMAVVLATMLFEPCLAAWKVAAAVGDERIGFGRSIRLMRGNYAWSIAFTLMIVVPPVALHYALAVAALGRTVGVTMLILFADALLVGVMGATMTSCALVIARRMTARHGVAIVPAASERLGASLPA